MKKIALFTIISLFSVTAFAQKTKKTKVKQKTEKTKELTPPVVVEKIVVDEILDRKEASVEVYETSEKYIGDTETTSSRSGDYIYEDIGLGYSIVKLQNQSYENTKIGIAKDRKLILPIIFKPNYNKNKPDCIILNIDNQFGVFNAVTQKWTLPLEYKSITNLNVSFLSVKKGSKFAIFSNSGEKIEDFIFNDIYTSIPNYLQINIANKTGLYNLNTRKITIPCIYSSLSFCEPCGNLFEVTLNNKHNLVDPNNNLKLKYWYDVLSRPNYEIANFIAKRDNKMGIINYNDEIILPFDYLQIESSAFSDGSLIAKNNLNKFGCVNIQGKTTLPFEYDTIETNYNDHYKKVFTKNDKCGLLQMNQGTPYEIATCEYENIETYKNFFIAKRNGKLIMLNNFNKPLNNFEFDSLENLTSDYYSSNNVFMGKNNGNYFLINSNGILINEKPYKSIEKVNICYTSDYFNEKAEHVYYKVTNDKNTLLLLDYNCNIIETNMVFDDIIAVYENNLIVKKNKKVGVYNLVNFSMKLNTEYDSITPTKNGYLVVQNGSYYLINYYDKTKTILLKN